MRLGAELATAAAAAVMSNASASCAASRNRPASYNSSTPHDGATSDNRATAVNSTAIISASTILVIRIAVRPAIIPASDDCSPPNHGSAAINRGSAVNCNASVNRTSAVAANGPDFHKLAIVYWRCENAFGARNGRAYRRRRKHHQASYCSNEQLDCQIGHNIRSFRARVNCRSINGAIARHVPSTGSQACGYFDQLQAEAQHVARTPCMAGTYTKRGRSLIQIKRDPTQATNRISSRGLKEPHQSGRVL